MLAGSRVYANSDVDDQLQISINMLVPDNSSGLSKIRLNGVPVIENPTYRGLAYRGTSVCVIPINLQPPFPYNIKMYNLHLIANQYVIVPSELEE